MSIGVVYRHLSFEREMCTVSFYILLKYIRVSKPYVSGVIGQINLFFTVATHEINIYLCYNEYNR